MSVRRARLRTAIVTGTVAVALATPTATGQSVEGTGVADTGRPAATIDPAVLDRGADPRIAYLVRDTIQDGDRQIRVHTPGKNLALYETRSGYLVWSYVYNRHMTVIAVDRDGDQRRLGQAELVYPVVSPNGRRVAMARDRLSGGARTVVRVLNPHTGHVLARRIFRGQAVGVYAVTDRRVMLSNVGDPEAPEASTSWWNYRRDTIRRMIVGWRPAAVDLRANRILLDHGWRGTSDCQRVAPLTHPRRTLWRACRIFPRDWNARGTRALATWRFWEFDRSGTNRWVVHEGRGPGRTGQVTGRLDWTAVWEGNRRFLTTAEGDHGEAAIIRCRFDGRCERASRLWRLPVDSDEYYVGPPVILAENG